LLKGKTISSHLSADTITQDRKHR